MAQREFHYQEKTSRLCSSWRGRLRSGFPLRPTFAAWVTLGLTHIEGGTSTGEPGQTLNRISGRPQTSTLMVSSESRSVRGKSHQHFLTILCHSLGETMPKNIVVCTDGTWNHPDETNRPTDDTNVVKLF